MVHDKADFRGDLLALAAVETVVFPETTVRLLKVAGVLLITNEIVELGDVATGVHCLFLAPRVCVHTAEVCTSLYVLSMKREKRSLGAAWLRRYGLKILSCISKDETNNDSGFIYNMHDV